MQGEIKGMSVKSNGWRHRWFYNWKVLALLVCDACAVTATVALSLVLRYDGHVPTNVLDGHRLSLALAVIVYLVIFGLYRLYHQVWRFASLDSLVAVVKACTYGTASLAVLQLMFDTSVMPRSVIILIWLLSIILVGSVRVCLRLLYQRLHLNGKALIARQLPPEAVKRTLIIGADERGADLVAYLRRHPYLGFIPLAFLDDDPAKVGMYIRGVRVFGTLADLSDTLDRLRITHAIIAIPSAPGNLVRSIVEECSLMGVAVKTLPSINEALNGADRPFNLREVRVEDLLRREPIKVDLDGIAAYLKHKRVMVTGGGGSIGSELCHQIAAWDPASLIVLDIDETGIFNVMQSLSEAYPDLNLQPVIADIRDPFTIRQHFTKYAPEIVFHAAAYKHVPLMEFHPAEAIRTNVVGTRILTQTARECRVERFILVSTDKAVNPTSVMGATKRAAELVLQLEGAETTPEIRGATKFMAVRFGNVLASRGSVLPIFQRQIEHGGPVTVTHPEMKRYFMTIPEAVQLVIQAGALGSGGEIFVLDMGKPVKILDLAKDLIRLSGFEPERDIPIVYTGLRPGEKLFEELLTTEERLAISRNERIYVCPSLNGDSHQSGNGRAKDVSKLIEKLVSLVATGAPDEALRDGLKEIVPNFGGVTLDSTNSPPFASFASE